MIKKHSFFHTVFLTVFVLVLAGPLLSCSILAENAKNTDSETQNSIAAYQNQKLEFSNPNCPIRENHTSYRLGANDKIEILVYNENNLSNEYSLPPTGIINLPLIGETMLGGCSARQVEQLLHQKYADGYLVNPGISVSILSYRPFYVIGEVQQPGQYDYVEHMNVLKAVAIAGGFTYRANKTKAKILTGEKNNKPTYRSIKIEDEIKPGDVIVIQERLF